MNGRSVGRYSALRTTTAAMLLCAFLWSRAEAQSPEPGTLREVIRIGEIDGPLALTRVDGMVVVDSVLFVAQSQEKVIRIISSNGTLLNTIGGRGQGPGEFERIDFIGFVDGQLKTIDLGARRRTSFSATGELIGTNRLLAPRAVPPLVWMATGEARSGQVVFTLSASVRYVDAYPALPVILATAEGVAVDTITMFDPRSLGISAVSETRAVGFSKNPIHDGPRHSVSPDGQYFVEVVGVDGGIEVRWYDTETRARSTRLLPIPPVPVPSEYADSIFGVFERVLRARGFSRSQIEDAVSFPTMVPAVDVAQVVSGGGVWIREPSFSGANGIWHLVTPEGSRWITVAPSMRFDVLDQEDDVVWGRTVDEYGVNYLVGLRLMVGG